MNELLHELAKNLSSKISLEIRDLLMDRHLYQSAAVPASEIRDEIFTAVAAHYEPDFGAVFAIRAQKVIAAPWMPDLKNVPPYPQPAFTGTLDTVFFNVYDVKLYCTACSRLEPFNVTSASDFLAGEPMQTRFNERAERVQVFVLSFTCQSCKGPPEVFLVRRQGTKLTLSGRAPMEHVPVPSVIPKSIAKYYSSATIGYQSGQTLAGLFLLRTLIEQWIRYSGAPEGYKADAALDWYMSHLPQDFKARFASLRDLYGGLSDAIHSAAEDEPLFNRTRSLIEEHFKAIKLFQLVMPFKEGESE